MVVGADLMPTFFYLGWNVCVLFWQETFMDWLPSLVFRRL